MMHGDHLGTPQVITDNNQNVVWKADYNPFGQATITTELIINNLRFPGQCFDSETNLHYNMYRYYDSNLGRYITSDPLGLIISLNTYAYVGGNPMRYIDPYGLSPEDVEKLYDQFAKSVDSMNKSGQRRPGSGMLNGLLNNFMIDFFPVEYDYLQCYEQAEEFLDDADKLDLDDDWDLNLVGNPPHYWTELVSSNKKDPILMADPWLNNIDTIPEASTNTNPWVDSNLDVRESVRE